MPGPRLSSRQPRPPGLLDAGPLGADIASFRLHLAAEGKSAQTVQSYTSGGGSPHSSKGTAGYPVPVSGKGRAITQGQPQHSAEPPSGAPNLVRVFIW
jgi:hypothetical protein